jgi:hypothetical protein
MRYLFSCGGFLMGARIKNVMAKWGINSYWDFFIINVVFALSGSSIVFVRKPFFNLVGITETTPFLIKFFTWLLIVFPTYQINLIIFGTLLGQFAFFWEKEKKMFKFFARHFSSKKKSI